MGLQLASDLKLKTTFLVCGVCSEKKIASELTSVVIEKNTIPDYVKLDESGVISDCPFGNNEMIQLYACNPCYCNGKVFWRYAIWNVYGLGKLGEEYWLSEELMVATISSSIAVKHGGTGGYSFKQEAHSGASFYYHDVLGTLWMMLAEEEWNEEQIAVTWVKQGQHVNSGAKMMIRVKMVLQLFLLLWKNNNMYQIHCLQCANGEWNEEKVEQQLIPKINNNLSKKKKKPFDKVWSNNDLHHWSWQPDPKWSGVKQLFVQIGSWVDDQVGMETELLTRAMPTMFSRVDVEKLSQLVGEFRFERFAKHLALLSDNRLGKHDRALFVLNYLVVQKRVSSSMFREGVLQFMEGVEDVQKLVKDLEEDIEEELKQKDEKEKKDNVAAAAAEGKEKSLVYKLIKGMKMFAKGVLGHPMARAGYRQELKSLHRMVSPGNV